MADSGPNALNSRKLTTCRSVVVDQSGLRPVQTVSISERVDVDFLVHLTKTDRRMRLVIDVDKQYNKLFTEMAKAAKARVRVEE